MPQKEVTATKSLSRFVEHFDMMPPTELLDMIGEEEQQQQQLSTSANNNEKSKKPTPLFALPGFNRHDTGNSLNGAVHPLQNTPSSPISPTRKSYLDRHDSSSPITPLESSPMSSAIQSSSSSPLSAHVGHAETVSNKTNGTEVPTTNSELPTTKSNSNARATSIINTIATNSNLSNIAQQQHKQSQQDQLFSPPPSSTRKKLSSKSSLNRAEFIIRRYESWNRFISLFIAWVNEIAKQSIQAEKAYQASLKESKFSFRRGGGDHHSTKNNGMHGFTADLALEEQKVGRHLQTDQIPNLEKFKKECTSIIKSLKSRPELNQEEFWRRAEITASLISQLNKTCIEARRTIEKGSPVVNDPWLVNLYVLRQLRGEVSEENRLRSLLVPIQQSIRDFEDRLFKAVEDTLKVCLEKPVTLSDDQLSKIQSSLNQVITNNWDTFAAMNKKDIVNEENPLKHYLKINYNCKNDPLVMTVHKGQLERRTGVLNSKYTQRFFVVTKSGFLHQFKLNDKVSPEFSLYLSKCTIVPCMDISDLNRFSQQQDLQEGKISKDGYTFEVQRSGSVLQRDKSYAFRANNFEDMVVWCQHISEVATQSPEATLRPVFVAGMQSTGALASSNSTTTSVEQYQEPDRQSESPPQPQKVVKSGGGSIRLSIDSYHLPQEGSKSQPLSPEVEINKRPDVPVHQAQLQESTPPPSPIKNEEQNYSTEGITFEERRVSEDSSGSFHSFIYETVERPKLYAPQLNI